MFIHAFAFRWKSGVSEAQKKQAQLEIGNLQGKIPGLLDTWTGINVSPRGQGYEFGGVMRFANKRSLDAYQTHPEHVKLLSWLVPLIDAAELDFEAQD